MAILNDTVVTNINVVGSVTAANVTVVGGTISAPNIVNRPLSAVGTATQPIYINASGVATACTYTLSKSVPSNAVFTDTVNTAGATDTSSKIFLVGATTQGSNPQTYSHDTVYVGTDGCLYSGGKKVAVVDDLTTAFKYQGTFGTGGTVTTLPDLAQKGDTYRCITAGTYTIKIAGTSQSVKLEVGDLIICITSGVSGTPASWTVIQNNIDVFGPATASAAGSVGLVPAPASGKNTSYLRGDGTWSVPTNTTYAAGTALTLTSGTFNHNNYVTAGTVGTSSATSGITLAVPYVTYNAQGHITATGTHTHTVPAMTGASSSAAGTSGLVPAPASGKQTSFLRGDGTWVVPTNTTYAAGTGLSLSGTTFNHSNSVTAGTIGQSTATSGITLDVPYATFDAQGHITGKGVHVHTIPAMTAATASAAGTSGLVPAPGSGKQTSFLRGDGTWVVPTNTDTKNTAGATNSTAKLFLVGAASQAASPQTYTNVNIFGDTASRLNAVGVVTESIVSPTHSDCSLTFDTNGNSILRSEGPAAVTLLVDNNTQLSLNAGTINLMGTALKFNGVDLNAAGGIVVLDSNGKIPSTSYTNTTYSAGTALSLSGTTFNHSNYVTAGTAGTSSATSGSTIAIPYVTYNAQGHITAAGTHTHTIPAYPTVNDGKLVLKINGSTIGTYFTANATGTTTIDLGSTPHYTATLVVGGTSTAQANAAATNGNVYLNLVENGTVRNAHNIVGSGATTVASDANGKITISSTNTTYAAGTALTLTSGTFNHNNYVTAGTAGTSSATSGDSIAIPYVTYNAQGHITAAGTHTHTITHPTIGNGKMILKINGGTKGNFTANQTSDSTIDLGTYSTTDTKNTAGSTNSTSKLFLVGATAQSANPQTYSNVNVFVDTASCINATGVKAESITSIAHSDCSLTFDANGNSILRSEGPASVIVKVDDSTNVTVNSGTVAFNATALYLNGNAQNAKNGIVVLDSNGKIPSSSYTNTTYGVVSTSANGLAPKITNTSGYLKGDGTWTVPPNTTYSAGTGLSLSGTTFNHSNSITAGTIGSSTATSGYNIDIPYASYDAQGHITGKGTHTHKVFSITTEADNRNVATKPTDYNNTFAFKGLKAKATISLTTSATYAYLFGLRGWSDNSGGKAHEIAFTDDGIYLRIESGTASWGSWAQLGYKGINIFGGTASTANAAATNGNVYLNHVENGKITSSNQIVGTGATTVVSDANGRVTINSTNTTYGVVSTSANGLAPKITNTSGYLKGDGTWAVPPNTDTKNTAGSTNSTSKLFIVGAASQAASPQTYSNVNVFIDTSSQLNASGVVSKKLIGYNTGADANETYIEYTDSTLTIQNSKGTDGIVLATNANININAGTTSKYVNIQAGTISFNGNAQNTNGGLVVLDSNGKIPSSSYTNTQPNNGTLVLKINGGTKSTYFTANATGTTTIDLGTYATTNTTYSAGTGLSLSGTTFNHSNSVTAGTAGTSSATSGNSIAIPYVTYDAQGHVTASGTHTHTITPPTVNNGKLILKINGGTKGTYFTANQSGDSTIDLGTYATSDTHYTATLVVGASSTAQANAVASNGNVYLNLVENGTIRNSHNVVGSGATSVTSDANGKITISSTNTTYNAVSTSDNGLAPKITNTSGYLKGDGTWTVPPDTKPNNGKLILKINGNTRSTYFTADQSGDATIDLGTYATSNTTYSAGTALALSGTTFNHSDYIGSIGTAGTSSATSGNSIAIPYITYNAQGHITAAGTHTHTITPPTVNNGTLTVEINGVSKGTFSANQSANTTIDLGSYAVVNLDDTITTAGIKDSFMTDCYVTFDGSGTTVVSGESAGGLKLWLGTAANQIELTNTDIAFTATSLIFNDNEQNTAGGIVVLDSNGKIPSTSYTDTKNTAGAGNTNSKIYLIGPTSQSTTTTYSHSTVYVDTSHNVNAPGIVTDGIKDSADMASIGFGHYGAGAEINFDARYGCMNFATDTTIDESGIIINDGRETVYNHNMAFISPSGATHSIALSPLINVYTCYPQSTRPTTIACTVSDDIATDTEYTWEYHMETSNTAFPTSLTFSCRQNGGPIPVTYIGDITAFSSESPGKTLVFVLRYSKGSFCVQFAYAY